MQAEAALCTLGGTRGQVLALVQKRRGQSDRDRGRRNYRMTPRQSTQKLDKQGKRCADGQKINERPKYTRAKQLKKGQRYKEDCGFVIFRCLISRSERRTKLQYED